MGVVIAFWRRSQLLEEISLWTRHISAGNIATSRALPVLFRTMSAVVSETARTREKAQWYKWQCIRQFVRQFTDELRYCYERFRAARISNRLKFSQTLSDNIRDMITCVRLRMTWCGISSTFLWRIVAQLVRVWQELIGWSVTVSEYVGNWSGTTKYKWRRMIRLERRIDIDKVIFKSAVAEWFERLTVMLVCSPSSEWVPFGEVVENWAPSFMRCC